MNTNPVTKLKPLKVEETTEGRVVFVSPTWFGRLLKSWSVSLRGQGGEVITFDQPFFLTLKNVTLIEKKNCKVFQEAIK